MDAFKPRDERKTVRSDKEFASPSHDHQTTGRGMAPGPSHGVGFRTPTGRFEARGMKEGPIPQESKCVDPNEI